MTIEAIPYDLIRALHILSVIAWMAGLLMLPRLYAYQTSANPGGELEAKMKQATQRLRRIILTPAMVAAWGFGLWLLIVFDRGMLQMPWLIAKLVLVTALSGLHGYYVAMGKRLDAGRKSLSERTWRILNELPFVMAIAIVLLATLEPF